MYLKTLVLHIRSQSGRLEFSYCGCEHYMPLTLKGKPLSLVSCCFVSPLPPLKHLQSLEFWAAYSSTMLGAVNGL